MVATVVAMEAIRTVHHREVHGAVAATATVPAGMLMVVVVVVLAVRETAMGRAETAFPTSGEAPTMEVACLAPVVADGVVRIGGMATAVLAEEAWPTTTVWPPLVVVVVEGVCPCLQARVCMRRQMPACSGTCRGVFPVSRAWYRHLDGVFPVS